MVAVGVLPFLGDVELVVGGHLEINQVDVALPLFRFDVKRPLPAQPGEHFGVTLDVVADRFEPADHLLGPLGGDDAGIEVL